MDCVSIPTVIIQPYHRGYAPLRPHVAIHRHFQHFHHPGFHHRCFRSQRRIRCLRRIKRAGDKQIGSETTNVAC